MTPRTRREVLAALLGVPAASSTWACSCKKSVPPGEIVGGDVVLGHHLLRAPPPDDDAPVDKVQVLVIGAGIAGLGAAWRLASMADIDMRVIELETELGGTSRAGRNDVSAYPWAAHYVPVPSLSNRTLIKLLREMGTIESIDESGLIHVAEEQLVTQPHERVFFDGAWHQGLMPEAALTGEDAAQAQRFHAEIDKWIAWRDGRGRRAFTLPMAMGSDDPEVTALDSMSMAQWLDRQGLRSRMLRWYVDLACRDDYGCTVDVTSAWAGLFYFASRTDTPGQPSSPFITWPEGNGRIVQHFRKMIGDHRLGLHQMARDVVPTQNGVRVSVVDGRTHRAVTIEAQHLIVAVPRFILGKLLRPWRDAPPASVTEFETSPWLVANLTLRERPANVGFMPAWDNVLMDSPSLGYVIATHQQGRSFGPTVFTYYYALADADPRRAREKLLSATREQWVEAILADLGRAHPDLRQLVERIDVYRWGHAMVRPRTGFVWSRERREASAMPFANVHVACADLSGVPLLEEALYHGVRAAEKVLGAAGRDVATWL